MSSQKDSIAAIMIMSIVTVTTLLLGALGVFYDTSEQHRQHATLQKELYVITNQLATALSLPVWNIDGEEIDAMIGSIMQDRNIYGVVAKASGKTYSSARDVRWGITIGEQDLPTGEFLVEEREITYRRQPIGMVKVLSTPKFVQEELRKTHLSIILLILSVDLVLILSLYLLIWYIMLRPLRAVEGYAMFVSSGGRDPLIIRGGRFHGELESLRAAIEKMVSLLAERYGSIQASEKECRNSQEFLHNIVENIPAMIFVKDAADLRFVKINRAGEELMGYRREELLGGNDYDFFPEHEADLFMEKDREVLHMGKLVEILEEIVQTKHRGERVLHTKKIPIFDKEGKPEYLLGISEDITERKRVEEALRESERFLRMVIDTEPECVKMLDSDGSLQMMNPAGLAMIGADSLEQVRGQSIYGLITPEYRKAFRVFTEGVFRGSSGNIELEMVGLNGQRRWMDIHAAPFHDAHGQIISVLNIARDISERKRAERALAEKQHMLEELNRSLEKRVADALLDLRQKDQILMQQSRQAAMGEMIGNIAHQWRQPLNMLGLIVQELPAMYKCGKLSKEYLDVDVTKAMDLINNMSKTIDDFGNFFKPDKEKVLFKVNRIVVKALSLIEQSLTLLNIKVQINETNDAVIDGYPNEYIQVLLNIINNARDAFVERKIEGRRVVTITILTENNRVVAIIADNAGGIPEEVLNKIFDPYFTTKGPNKGTGIGLYMAKNIIEKNMGGRLTVRNIKGGAEFRIEV